MELENKCVGMGTEGLIELGRARESDSEYAESRVPYRCENGTSQTRHANGFTHCRGLS